MFGNYHAANAVCPCSDTPTATRMPTHRPAWVPPSGGLERQQREDHACRSRDSELEPLDATNPLKDLGPSMISEANSRDLPRLFDIWESAVRATHFFLTESDLQTLAPLVRAELSAFSPIYCVRDTDGNPFAFMGVRASKIEMLFVHAGKRGTGTGRLLVEFAIQTLGATAVDVNEQNSLAVGFYRHLGFCQVGRSPLDSSGNPFPILHCRVVRSDRVPDSPGEYAGCQA